MAECRIEHFGICVADIDRAVEWYKTHFGFEEIKRFEKADMEIKGAVIALGDQYLEILQPYTPQSAEADNDSLIYLLRRIGANHIALSVHDVLSVYDMLRDNHVQFVTELIDGRFFFCKDPDGTLLEIRQRK